MGSPQGIEPDYHSTIQLEAEKKVEEEKTGGELAGQPVNQIVKIQEPAKEASTDTALSTCHDVVESEKDITVTPQPWIATNITFTRSKNKKNWKPPPVNDLKNSLLAGAGFLELANAADFAANIWNEIPVPTFAAVLMGIGGVFALLISISAFHDIVLARRNCKLLKRERDILKKREESKDRTSYISINFRQLGTEVIDRIGMDAFMGFGAVMVGTGTLLAIGGANPKIYRASNLLSGYIGNTPVAVFGIFNVFWSLYVIIRAQKHCQHAQKYLSSANDKEILDLLRKRTRQVQSHAIIMGSIGIVAGGASLVTAEYWIGYPILLPCVILSAYCNWAWRKKVGYSRPLCDTTSSPIANIEKEALMEEISINAALLESCRRFKHMGILENVVEEPESMASILEFLVRHGLFITFCAKVLKDVTLRKIVFGPTLEGQTKIEVSPGDFLLLVGKPYFVALKDVAGDVVGKGILEKLMHRERFLLEALGCLSVIEMKITKRKEKGSTEKGKK